MIGRGIAHYQVLWQLGEGGVGQPNAVRAPAGPK